VSGADRSFLIGASITTALLSCTLALAAGSPLPLPGFALSALGFYAASRRSTSWAWRNLAEGVAASAAVLTAATMLRWQDLPPPASIGFLLTGTAACAAILGLSLQIVSRLRSK